MDKLLLSAKGTLAILEFMGSTEPTPDNVWNEQAYRLRADVDRLQVELKGSTSATDIEAPTRAL